jgi:uncharacterized membrane protein YgdD (TMEM256/DUF423 family)
MTRATRWWLAIAGIVGLVSVAAGAAAAHLADPRAGELLRTAALYGMVHAAALPALAALCAQRTLGGRIAALAGWSFAGGLVLFPPSLVALAVTGWRFWGFATPVGGGLLMLGWAALAVAAWGRPVQ